VYKLLSYLFVVATAPLWLPVALYIGVVYSWEDTVPKPEDD
jgi:hypothetical protein